MARKKAKAKAAPSARKTGGREHSTNNNPTIRESPIQGNASISVGGAVALFAVLVFYVYAYAYAPLTPKHDVQKPKEVFLKWFVDNGGTFYPIRLGKNVNVTMEQFSEYGGWGLALSIPPTDELSCHSETADGQCIVNNPTSLSIKHLDPLFTVPSSVIISVESVLDTYASPSSPFHTSGFNRVNAILKRAFPLGPGLAHRGMGLIEQDVVMALYLLVEECQHRHPHLLNKAGDTQWGPYLDVLPQYIVPRLDTFGDEEYAALQDETLELAGRTSQKALAEIFNGGSNSVNGPSLKAVLQDMIRTKSGPTSPIPESCTSFDTFHKFVAIVSSRAMLLEGVKYLTPLAEMINYAPREERLDLVPAPFHLYHTLSADKSITVSSDRDVVFAKTSDEAYRVQLFEDYGPVDNSLFLEAHGFVPYENPHNCAVISGTFFLQQNAVAGSFDETVSSMLRALQALHLIHPAVKQFDTLGDMCVTSGLSLVEDGNTIGLKPASDSIAITSLLSSESNSLVWDATEHEYGTTRVLLREKCVAALAERKMHAEQIEISCARYPGSGSIVKQAMRAAARHSIQQLEDKGDTEAELLLQLQRAESQGRDRLAVALRFRLAERKLLSQIAHYKLE